MERKIMITIKNFILKYKFYIIPIIIMLIVLLTFNFNKKDKVEAKEVVKQEVKKEEVKEKIKYLKIDIKGEVKKPGVYELEEGKRVIDSINMAGGFTKNANTSYINLSKKLTDEMIIIVYSNEEIANMDEKENIIVYMEKKCECPSITNDACINNKGDSKGENIKQEKININSATISQLITLQGIGESKAEAIIEYRNLNGNFKSIEDIKNVSGIGESAYSKIKENITI